MLATQTVVVGPGGVLKATNLDCSSLMFAGMLTDAMTSPVAADKVVTCGSLASYILQSLVRYGYEEYILDACTGVIGQIRPGVSGSALARNAGQDERS